MLSEKELLGHTAVQILLVLMAKRAGMEGHTGTQNLVEKSAKRRGEAGH